MIIPSVGPHSVSKLVCVRASILAGIAYFHCLSTTVLVIALVLVTRSDLEEEDGLLNEGLFLMEILTAYMKDLEYGITP
ncbi:hypothetical protein ACTXT7_008243 [Hymenolepis weldensis]